MPYVDINEEEYELLQKNASIKMMEPSKVIQIENVPFHRPNVVFYQQSPILFDTCSGLIESQLVEGRLPQQSNEVLASNTFVFENHSYSLGKTIRLGDKDYQICGVYKYQLLSFDKKLPILRTTRLE